ncbi:hypothetical protein A2230_03995 [candidate division WOR-1 bacterium RIFOXYA2_FULL_36_21]|uniref:Transporter n=1 Tax=candidate division WOR-1 bacterium RIFOXYB2_FULL_36_35 TaxID=1802578 RepID=A0A1F4S2C3_UNCSA|nr:MAG: hypothetical protein A2230_03995 [candidate division WOR-1 bacterium RIFOXYA2_FULL_36_21]OGC14527.1 MAG: hypothetical protein A2290_00010 [candidate division WOR-1 bacterium RIFOXYB2_FULL_36_35]OGC16887.1 MAG: hypothetical protein A2282_08530 [candidate division WOR-1 bacterium RIFOXYA12_FULL_36_13]
MSYGIFRRVFVLMLILFNLFSSSYGYRPFGTEDASVCGLKVSQLEASIDYLKWNSGDKESFLLFVPIYGITENCELSFEVPYMFHHLQNSAYNDGISDINLVVKYLLLPEDLKHGALAIKTVLKTDTGDFNMGLGSGDKDLSFVLAYSQIFKQLTMHYNLGYTFIGKSKDENLRNIFLYGIAFDYSFNQCFSIVSELNGNRHPDSTQPEDPRNFMVGIIFKKYEKAIFDVASRWGLSASSPDWNMTSGVSLTF